MKLLTALLLVMGVCCATKAAESIVYYDATGLLQTDLRDEQQRRQFWDELHLLTALEGLANRDQPRLFVRFLKKYDDFWWDEMRKPGGWLASRDVVEVSALNDLLARYRQYYRGAVVWDERVPAASDVASSVAGCDDLLPLRYDSSPASLFRRLTVGTNALAVRVRLPNFARKSDAYSWLIDKYLATGKANPLCMGYYLDAFWLKCWNVSAPENNGLCDQDYIIAHRGVVFDLDPWDDESPVDDPHQTPGTDADALKRILRTAYDRSGGNSIIDVHGFVPWAFKYTDFHKAHWAAGGRHEGVATEWRYAEILSCFNACMDADALSLNAMPNASFYQHYPLAPQYRQNPKPSVETLKARGFVNNNGAAVKRTYVAFYVGDYDSAAWLYQSLPKMWRDPARGATPLSWAFNPNLSQRFPLGLAWACAHKSANDWFVAGDSGAGYLNPGYLTPPRPWSGLPSGMPAWEQRCAQFYRQWDLSLTGFVIDGNGRPLPPASLDAYAKFSPDGIVESGAKKRVHDGMPILPMTTDVGEKDPAAAARHILDFARGPGLHLLACRSVLKTPSWHAQVAQELVRERGDQIKIVDLYTLLQLARESVSAPR